tara:strand:- start:54 stop:485 length:432 start_codon:yes stop_codon:yes gene_type:complete
MVLSLRKILGRSKKEKTALQLQADYILTHLHGFLNGSGELKDGDKSYSRDVVIHFDSAIVDEGNIRFHCLVYMKDVFAKGALKKLKKVDKVHSTSLAKALDGFISVCDKTLKKIKEPPVNFQLAFDQIRMNYRIVQQEARKLL